MVAGCLDSLELCDCISGMQTRRPYNVLLPHVLEAVGPFIRPVSDW
jgi:hypothetical protein